MLRKKVFATERNEIVQSGLFAADWYLARHPDVAKVGSDPVLHYLESGAAQGYDPGPGFSTKGYLARYPDVAKAGMNPLLHYLRHGKAEGRCTGTPGDLEQVEGERTYRNFAEFLKESLLQPVVQRPFEEVDRCCFALMDRLAAHLAALAHACDKAEAPLVSVIMPALNRETVIADAIESVLRQSYGQLELVIIDDGSTDSTASVASRYAADARVRIESSPERRGVSAARNRGLALARGELIAYLDSDNSWLPDYLAAMVGAFLQHPDLEAAYSGQYIYHPAQPVAVAVRFGCYNKSLLENHNYIDINCFMHRRLAPARAGGGFDEALKRLVDWDLILRISRSSRMMSVPVLQSNYFHQRTGNTITGQEALAPALDTVSRQVAAPYPTGKRSQLDTPVAVVVVACGAADQLPDSVQTLQNYYRVPEVELILVASGSPNSEHPCLAPLRSAGVKLTMCATSPGFFRALQQGAALARPDADLVLLYDSALLEQGTIEALQAAAYAAQNIALTVPQQVLPAGHPQSWIHVPSVLDALPCDVTLSHQHRNVEQLGILHDGELLELNFTPFFCVYLKREVWQRLGSLDLGEESKERSERVTCEYIRHVLGMKIVYTPAVRVRVKAATV